MDPSLLGSNLLVLLMLGFQGTRDKGHLFIPIRICDGQRACWVWIQLSESLDQ